jgi:hypothetical protein
MIGRSRARARRATPKPPASVPATALVTETSDPLVTETGTTLVTE